MKRRMRRLLMLLLAMVLVGSVGMLLHQQMDYSRGAEDYAEATALAGLAEEEAIPLAAVTAEEAGAADSPAADAAESGAAEPAASEENATTTLSVDLAALQAVNSDVIGWVMIPGTTISYPLMQGDDNQYYLTHTWKNEENAVGAIFLDARNHADRSDFHTIIYGHRMNDDSMFGPLHDFSSQTFWDEHPWVVVTTAAGSVIYEIFAAYEADVMGSTYQLSFAGEEGRQLFLDDCMAQSLLDTAITPTVSDQILTLSTCTTSGSAAKRWVVQARRVG